MKLAIIKNLFIILMLLSILSCNYMQIKNANLTRPTFESQKTYVLEQNIFQFGTYYAVWTNYPVDLTDFNSPEEIKNAQLFEIIQQFKIARNKYIINDRLNNVKYSLSQTSPDKLNPLTSYIIEKNGQTLGKITQIYANNILKFELTYKNQLLNLNGQINDYSQDIHSFVYNLIDKDGAKIAVIFKQFRYFRNEYEIISNLQIRAVEPVILIALGVFIDQILKENNYQYK